MALVWAEFTDRPDLEQYRNLKNHADRADQWPSWREKALLRIRKELAAAKRAAERNRWSFAGRADHSPLVRVFLWEKKLETAWNEATAGGCSNDLWLELATKREQRHPEDALEVYKRQIEHTVARTSNEAYRDAIGLLRRVNALLVRVERKSEFAEHLESVRSRFKMKRNFIKLIDRAKWS